MILSLGPNSQDLWQKDGIPFYFQKKRGEEGYDPTKNELYQYKLSGANNDEINDHYFMVTGIMVDYVTQKTMLSISSWGINFYIDYKQYREYVNQRGDRLTSSMVNIGT